jgi:hypothetical protein
MQTFVPENTFANSVRVLDRQRLGKQRVETLQIMKALAGLSKGWTNHPATRMWRGYERALLEYQHYTVNEWKRRGYKDTCYDKTLTVYIEHFNPKTSVTLPHWWGDNRVHNSHKSALVFKDPVWYNTIYPDVEGVYDYYWPV